MSQQYPRLLTPGQIKAMNESGKTLYRIAKDGNLAYTNLLWSVKGRSDNGERKMIQLGTALKISTVIGMPLEQFEKLD